MHAYNKFKAKIPKMESITYLQSPLVVWYQLILFMYLFNFETGSHSVSQAELEWHKHGSLQP